MKIYHVYEIVFIAAPKETEGDCKIFNVCYATSRERALEIAKEQIAREGSLSFSHKERNHVDPSGPWKTYGGEPWLTTRKEKSAFRFNAVLALKVNDLDLFGASILNEGCAIFLEEAETDTLVTNYLESFN